MPKSDLRPSGGIVVRTPRLARHVLDAWSADAREVDRDTLRARLRELITRPDIREAIYVASPSLEAAIDAWIVAPTSEDSKKTERGLVRYIARMATRPTPFGLFAGNSVGAIGAATLLELGPVESYRRYTRVDGDYLSALCDAVVRIPEIRTRLTYRPNTSICLVAGRLRYAMRREGQERTYTLVSVEPTPHIVATLERARRGALPSALAAAIRRDEADVEFAEAEAFIDELIASQILVSTLAPLITGDEALDDVIDQLAAVGVDVTTLCGLRDALRALDQSRDTPTSRYREIATSLETSPAKPRIDRLVQVNLMPAGRHLELGVDIIEEVIAALGVMHRMAPRIEDDELARFRDAFIERYDTREVELVEVLDEDAGIGFAVAHNPAASASPLFDGVTFPSESPTPRTIWTPTIAHLAHRIGIAVEQGASEIALDSTDVAKLTGRNASRAPLPDSMYVMLELTRAADGELRVSCTGVGGPPGGVLLGRFAHSDPAIREVVAANTSAEAALRPGVVFAEIAHLTEGRLANIAARPVLRSHEIVYLGRSGAPAECQLELTDLLVSVQRGRVVLRSKRLGVIIEPRLSTAHNVSIGSLGPYRFLVAVQRQSCANPRLEIGPLASLPRVPRIRLGRVVLRDASWVLRKAELATLATMDDRARGVALDQLRADRRLPRWIGIEDGDNVLAVDLDNALSVDSFLHLVKSRERVMIVEIAQSAEELVVVGAGGRYAAEIVVPLVRTATATPVAVVPVASRAVRRFIPTSEWLYTKLYTGRAGADRVLVEALAPVVLELPRWFFIRYGDPQWHVRVRAHGDPRHLTTVVLPAIVSAVQPLLDDGTVSRLELDTYDREIERYGGTIGVELAERLFHADSACVVAALADLGDAATADARWRLATLGIERLLDDFELDLDQRYDLLRKMRDGFAAEHRVDTAMRRSFGDKFRSERASLNELFGATSSDHPLALAIARIAERSAANAPIVDALRTAERSAALTMPMVALLESYVHMHVNRVVRDAHRAHEAVIYDLLARHYESSLARRRGSQRRS